MHMTRQYAAGRARNAGEKTAGFWTRGARTVTDLVPGLPRVDLVPAVERYFDLVQRTVDINPPTVRWAQAVGTLSGAVREKAESAGDLAREKAEAADNVMREQAEKAQQAVLERVKKAEQAEQGLARQARQAEREQARRAHKRARERYEGLTKAELSDQLAKRELPKTGNADALIERLVEADSK
jgi:SAP domain